MHHLALVLGNALGQNIHGPLQIPLVQNIGNTHLVDALAGGFIEGCAGGKHDGVAVVIELFQQPALELIGVIYGQTCHDIEGTHGFFHHHAGNLTQLPDNGVTAFLIFSLTLPEELMIHAV